MKCLLIMFTISSLSSIQGSKNKHSGGKSVTYCECFGKPGTEIIENNSDDVLVRNVGIATLQEHFPRPN